MGLLERSNFLDTLSSYVEEAASGSGRFVLVAGEAGVGKTALLEAFRALHPTLRWWWSACDGSFTPRPLGPLYEIAAEAGDPLRTLCRTETDRRELFAAFLDELGRADRPTVVVVEDLHWADDATLDWVRHLARRIARSPAVVVVSYRDDEPVTGGVLRPVIGQLATHSATRRMSLPPLSSEAVRRLAGDRTTDADQLHRLTGGVPFYVNEVLTARPGEVPGTIADVVVARMAHLSPAARHLLAAAAVVARPAGAALLATVAEADAAALDECLESGTLVGGPHAYRFRHELTRMAVEAAVPGHGRSRLHAAALRAVQEAAPDDHARLAHHAEAAGDARRALHHARLAAADAVAMRSNREAAVQFRRALRFATATAPATGPEDRAALHEGLATALALMDHWAESAEQRALALALRRELGDPSMISENLRWQSRCLWRLCRGAESLQAAQEALDLMADAPPSSERAWAYAFYAAAVAEGPARTAATATAREAARLGEEVGCPAVTVHALNTLGVVTTESGGDGLALLRRSIELAREHDLEDQAARGYANLYQTAVDRLRLAEHDWCFTEGIAYCHDNDLRTYAICLRGTRATVLLRTGRLAATAALVEETLREDVSPVNRLHLLIPLAVARLRQGDPRAGATLEDAWQLAVGIAERRWLLLLACALAEAAWLDGRPGALDERVPAVLAAGTDDDPWLRAELAVWLDRLGRLDRLGPPDRFAAAAPGPFALELAGEHEAAARWWHEAGCPLEEALALSRSPRPGRLAEALRLITSIDADAAAGRVRRIMREAGERSIPRGVRTTTRAHPDGLTPREAEVLALLRDGLSNASISRRLYISERTVHHHVSAVLAKLGVASRTDVPRPAGVDVLGQSG